MDWQRNFCREGCPYDELTDGSAKNTQLQTADEHAVGVPLLASQPSQIAAPVAAGQVTSDTPVTAGKGSDKAEGPFVTNGPSSSDQTYIPTTSATFVLNTDLVTTSDGPVAGATNSKTTENLGNTQQIDAAKTTVDIPLASPPAPPMVLEQGAANL
ncbi:hypothetical protein GQX73_g7783 [Xylaria multiplex]|uniref:Uncharacterized protein n=1 Tax=Xylaria multiplex TaxID=323545 RepID=A0A7C8IKB3_9PEZI|nr:hypothetical protein GQX73_g7783 [Xylaria multiplex]